MEVEELLDKALYYDLIEIKLREHVGNGTFSTDVIHIPVPLFFRKMKELGWSENTIIRYLNRLERHKRRNSQFFDCPVCNRRSFFAGPCYRHFHIKETDEWKEFTQMKDKLKEEFMLDLATGAGRPKFIMMVSYVPSEIVRW